jgi:hypothetical protein
MNDWKDQIHDINRWNAQLSWSQIMPLLLLMMVCGMILGFCLFAFLS